MKCSMLLHVNAEYNAIVFYAGKSCDIILVSTLLSRHPIPRSLPLPDLAFSSLLEVAISIRSCSFLQVPIAKFSNRIELVQWVGQVF